MHIHTHARLYSLPLNNTDLNCMALLICIKPIDIFSLPYEFLNNTFFSLPYFIIRIQPIIRVTYKICVYLLFMLPAGY